MGVGDEESLEVDLASDDVAPTDADDVDAGADADDVADDDVAPAVRRVLSSVFSLFASPRRFSSASMCILYSRFMDVSLVIFCSRSWFSVISPLVLSSKSLMYSFLRWRERAADCLFFNNLSCLFLVLSSSDLNSTLNLPRSEAAWISDAEAASSSSFSVGLIISIQEAPGHSQYINATRNKGQGGDEGERRAPRQRKTDRLPLL